MMHPNTAYYLQYYHDNPQSYHDVRAKLHPFVPRQSVWLMHALVKASCCLRLHPTQQYGVLTNTCMSHTVCLAPTNRVSCRVLLSYTAAGNNDGSG